MASALDQLNDLGKTLGSINNILGGGGSTTSRSANSNQTTTSSGGTSTLTGSTTQTTGSDITPEGIQRIIDTMMSGPGGVKDISGAARGSGLFNSSTEAQLTNDLQARVAGEAAKASAKTTTTNTQNQTTTTSPQTTNTIVSASGNDVIQPNNAINPLQALGVLSMGSKLLGGLGGNAASSAIDLGGVTAAPSLDLGAGLSAAGLAIPGLASVAPAAGDILSGTLGNLGDFANTSFSAGLDGASAAGNAISGLGSFGSVLGPATSFIGGLTGQNVFSNPISLGMSSIGTGLALAPMLGPLAPLGFLAGPAFSALGGLFKGSVICTALIQKGLLDSVEYAKGDEYIKSLNSWTIKGYYLWGTHVADQIRNNNPWAIALTLPLAVSRMKLIASTSKWKYLKYPLGSVTLFIGQPICWLLGGMVTLVENGYGRFN